MSMELLVVEVSPNKPGGVNPHPTIVDDIRLQIQQQGRILSIFIEKSNTLEIKVSKLEEDNKSLNATVCELKVQLDKSRESNTALQKHVQQMEIERAELLSYIEVLREALKNQHRNSLAEIESILKHQDEGFLEEASIFYANLISEHKQAALEIANALKSDTDFLTNLTEKDVVEMIKADPKKMQEISNVIRKHKKVSARAIALGLACGLVFFAALGTMAYPLLGVAGIAAKCLIVGGFGVGGAVVGSSIAVHVK